MIFSLQFFTITVTPASSYHSTYLSHIIAVSSLIPRSLIVSVTFLQANLSDSNAIILRPNYTYDATETTANRFSALRAELAGERPSDLKSRKRGLLIDSSIRAKKSMTYEGIV